MQENLVDKLVEECPENIDEVKFAGMALFEHGNERVCSYAIFLVLAVTALAISIWIGACFVYFRWYLKRDVTSVKFGTLTQTAI